MARGPAVIERLRVRGRIRPVRPRTRSRRSRVEQAHRLRAMIRWMRAAEFAWLGGVRDAEAQSQTECVGFAVAKIIGVLCDPCTNTSASIQKRELLESLDTVSQIVRENHVCSSSDLAGAEFYTRGDELCRWRDAAVRRADCPRQRHPAPDRRSRIARPTIGPARPCPKTGVAAENSECVAKG
jgi:hypothetical protein